MNQLHLAATIAAALLLSPSSLTAQAVDLDSVAIQQLAAAMGAGTVTRPSASVDDATARYGFSFAPVSCATPDSVVWPALRPSRKSWSENVA